MLIPTIILGLAAVALLYVTWQKGDGGHIESLRSAAKMTLHILPLLFFAFVVAGTVTRLIPAQTISHWVGAESGWRGIFVGAFVGGLAPGGPFVSLPIAVTLIRSGASVATMVAFLTGWSVWSFNRLPLDLAILGWKLTLIRLACSLILPPIAGATAMLFFSGKTTL